MILRLQKLKNLNLQKMNRFKYLFVGALFLHLLTLFFDVGSSCKLAIAPLLLGTLAAAGGAALNDVANQVNKSNARYSLDLQKDLLDYQWKNFVSPAAQLKSYADAGINPAVALGQGGLRSASPSGSAPVLAQSDIGLSGQDFAQTILALSQAKKAGSESAGIELENYLKQKTMDDNIKAAALRNKWTTAEVDKINAEITNFSALWNKTQAEIDSLRKEQDLTQKEINWYDREMSAKINELQSSAKYKNAVADLTDSQKDLLDAMFDDLCDITHSNAQIQDKAAQLLNRYGDAQAIVGMLSDLVGSASELIGSFTNFRKLGKAFDEVTDEVISNGEATVTKRRRVHRQ